MIPGNISGNPGRKDGPASDDFSNFSRFYTGGAYIGVLPFAFVFICYLLQVGQPSAPRGVVRMTDFVTDGRTLPANGAFSAHSIDLPLYLD